jgi:glycosyltransferase involved in cell wall biosynthesis
VTAGIVWFVVPAGIDDPGRVSGGNVYDQRLVAGLRTLGWDVRVVEVAVAEVPVPDPFVQMPDGALVLVDGLVAMSVPAELGSAAGRLRVVMVAHMLAAAFPDADARTVDAERKALTYAHRVIAVSEWLRDELVQRNVATVGHVAVAAPGSDPAPIAPGTPTGGSLLCVGVVAAHKGQDTLVEALAELGSGPWTCTVAGSVATAPGFAQRVAAQAARAGLSERIAWAGVLGPDELDGAYARADLLVAPSRAESYGIAVGEALRRGIPVIASRVGGIPEAARPSEAAVLVPPGNAPALSHALRRWIEDPALRARMSAAAVRAAPRRRGWSDTANEVHSVLAELT